jgi:hypothetical protein
MKRVLKISLVILAGIVIATWIGLKIYLRSSGVREQVEAQLGAAYGGPASIDAVDIGLWGTTIDGMKLFEPGDDPVRAAPLVAARSVTLDEPLWNLARGAIAPTRVHVNGGKVLVRFNRAGEVVTRFPDTLHSGTQALPWDRIAAVTVDDSEVTLRKEGHGELTANHIQARLTKENGRLILAGNAESEVGKLTLSGSLDEKSQQATDRLVEPQAPKYSDLKFNLKNASLAEIIKNENIKLPFPVDGKISVQLRASIPLDRLSDLKAYKADGSAKINQLSAAGVMLDELTANFNFGDGVLYIKSLTSAFADNAGNPQAAGALTGSGRIQVVPLGEMQAELRLDMIPIAKLTDLTPQQAQGSISGMLTIQGSADKLPDAKTLQANGKFEASTLVLFGVKVEQLGTALALKDGVLSLPGLQARVDGQLIAPMASVQIADDHSLLVQLGLGDRDLGALRKIAADRKIAIPPVTGSLNAKAVVKATTDPSRYAISGDIETKSLTLDKAALEDVRVHWELEGNQVNLNAALYDGKLAGSATLPKNAKASGKVDLRVQDLNIRRLARDLRMPVAVDGHVAGTLKATLTPEGKDKKARTEIEVDFKSPMLRVQNLPAEQLQGKLEYQAGRITYNLTGKSLGGTFDLQGEVPDEEAPAKLKAKQGQGGRLRVNDVRVGRLLKGLGVPDATDMRGLVNLDLPFTHDTPDRFPKGAGKLRLSDVQFGNNVLATNIQGEVIVGDQQIRVRNLEGDLAQGTLSGQIVFFIREPDRSAFTLNLDGVESGRLLSAWLDKKVEGPVQARIRGKLGSVSSGNADIVMTRGKISGLEIADWRLPVSWSFSPLQGRASAEIAETSLQLARGRANGKLTVAWDNGARVDGVLRLDRVELGELVRQAGSIAAGRTTAKLEIKGSGVRSVNDLSGTLIASFEQAQALQVPVLQQIAPFVGLGPSTTFQKGNLVARLDRGTARIQQLALQGNNTQVFLDGTVTMRQELNLHVVAKTTDVGWPTLRLGPIGLRLPVAGPVPLVVAQEVSNLISNQVVYLDVTGTPSSPVIRPRTLQILSSEAVRFFLNPSNSPVTLNP